MKIQRKFNNLAGYKRMAAFGALLILSSFTTCQAPDSTCEQGPQKSRSPETAPEVGEPAWVADYKTVLRTRTVTLDFQDTPVSDVIRFLQDITGLNITISPDIDAEDLRITLRLKGVVVQDALDLILQQTDLALTFQNESIKIIPKGSTKGLCYLDILEVQDLLYQAPDDSCPRIQWTADFSEGRSAGSASTGGAEFNFGDAVDQKTSAMEPQDFTEMIRDLTGQNNWTDPASIELSNGLLIIFQTPEVHRKVRSILEGLRRRNIGLFLQIKTYLTQLVDRVILTLCTNEGSFAPPESSDPGTESLPKVERVTRTNQETAELRLLLRRGCEQIAAGDYSAAIAKLEDLFERIRWVPYKIDEGIEDRARQLLIEARALLADRETSTDKGSENNKAASDQKAPIGDE